MRFTIRAATALAAILLGLMASAGARAESVTIPGSGNNEFLLGALARAFNASQGAHTVVIPPSSGTAGGLRAMEERTTAIARVGRPLKDSEHRPGVDYVALGHDAVVFVGGAGVTVKSLSAAQVVDIFSGRTANWSALGGKSAPIRAIERESTDASRQVIAARVPAFANVQYADSVKVVHLDPQLIELLDRYPSSIAFINRSALGAARSKVNVLAFEGVAPTPANLASGTYPLRMTFGLIVRKEGLGPGATLFLAYIQSAAGAAIVREHGVLPAATP